MSRYRSYGQLDNQHVAEGDFFFKGIDEKHDRDDLEPGRVPKSINKRLRTGKACTRPGSRTPGDFNANFVNNIVGSVVYSNPNGYEQLLVAEANRSFVWALQEGQPAKQIPISFGGTPLGTDWVWLVQAFDKVLLLRPGVTPCEWAGLGYGIDNGFLPIAKLDPSDTSTNLIPNVGYGISCGDRMFYVYGNDTVIVSDINDYTSYDNVYGSIRINSGSGDKIVCMHAFTNQTVLVFMKRSVHRLFNFSADLALAAQDLVNDELGAVGREAAVQVGADVIFLSRAGFYRVDQVDEHQTVSAPVPISDLLPKTIAGINWEQIEYNGMVSLAVLGDYMHALLPLGRNFPRNVLLYNTVTSEWESVDAWEDTSFYCHQLRVTIFDGERRLFAINATGRHVHLLYEGITDQTPSQHNVNDILETRGYGRQGGPHNFKRFLQTYVSVRTRYPSFSITALTDGYNEEQLLTYPPITKDPTKFYVWGHKDFATGDDPNEPKRQDYYTGSESEWVAQDMSNLLPGTIDLLPAVESEMLGGPTTESSERRLIRATGRWVSIRIENTQGECDILGVAVDYDEARRDLLIHA